MIIKERLEQTKYGFVTNYAGDIVNFMVNKPKIYRITYYPGLDIYAICDGYENIHLSNDRSLEELGYVDEVLHDEDFINFLFIPTEFIDDKEKWEVYGVGENERAYLTPITTGYIITYDGETLTQDISELYEILKRRHLLVDLKPKNDILFPELNLDNWDAYNYLAMNVSAYLKSNSGRLIMGTPEKQMKALRQLKQYITTHERPKNSRFKYWGYWFGYDDEELDEIEQKLNKHYDELHESILKLKIREINTMLK